MLKTVIDTKNTLMLKVGDKTRTVDTNFEEARKTFLSECEAQVMVVKNIQKQEDQLQASIPHMLAFAETWKLILHGDYIWERYRATITQVEAAAASHSGRVREYMNNIQIYVAKIPDVKHSIKERDNVLVQYDLQLNELNSLRSKLADTAKITAAEQRTESKKRIYDSQHDKAVEELTWYHGSKPEFDSYIYQILLSQQNFHASITASMKTIGIAAEFQQLSLSPTTNNTNTRQRAASELPRPINQQNNSNQAPTHLSPPISRPRALSSATPNPPPPRNDFMSNPVASIAHTPPPSYTTPTSVPAPVSRPLPPPVSLAKPYVPPTPSAPPISVSPPSTSPATSPPTSPVTSPRKLPSPMSPRKDTSPPLSNPPIVSLRKLPTPNPSPAISPSPSPTYAPAQPEYPIVPPPAAPNPFVSAPPIITQNQYQGYNHAPQSYNPPPQNYNPPLSHNYNQPPPPQKYNAGLVARSITDMPSAPTPTAPSFSSYSSPPTRLAQPRAKFVPVVPEEIGKEPQATTHQPTQVPQQLSFSQRQQIAIQKEQLFVQQQQQQSNGISPHLSFSQRQQLAQQQQNQFMQQNDVSNPYGSYNSPADSYQRGYDPVADYEAAAGTRGNSLVGEPNPYANNQQAGGAMYTGNTNTYVPQTPPDTANEKQHRSFMSGIKGKFGK